MGRIVRLAGPAVVLSVGGCLPDNFFANLLGSAIAEVAGVVLSDFLNTFFPPI